MTKAPVYIALHVPKCAGSTVERHLNRHLGNAAFWSPAKRSRSLPLELFARKYADRPPGPVEGIRAVSGHFVGRSVERHFPGRAIHRSVLLREPRALMLSWYNFRMRRYRAQGRATYPFGLHLRSLPPDPVAHFLLERWLETPWTRLARMGPEARRAALDAMLAGFDRVGDVADCDALVAEISRGLGLPEAADRRNTDAEASEVYASDWQPVTLDELSGRDLATLDARTGLDLYLWRRWALGETAAEPPSETLPFLAGELSRAGAEIRRRLARRRA